MLDHDCRAQLLYRLAAHVLRQVLAFAPDTSAARELVGEVNVHLVVSYIAGTMDEQRAEICEHKGDKHPDSLCDGVAGAVSRALCGAYVRAYGEIRHHNVDKALLIGGQSHPRFGGGEVGAPMRLIIAGRADPLPAPDDVAELAHAAWRVYLRRTLRHLTEGVSIEVAIRGGAGQLRRTVGAGTAVPVANDTSYGAGYAPYSRLERAVLELSSLLRSPGFRAAFPVAGDDVKVMGRRIDDKIGMTIALAFVDREVSGVDDYFAKMAAMETWLAERIAFDCAISINTLDARDASDENGIYLTVTGTSAEHGDDGQVGRGNRVNRLIAPSRTMSLETAAGKNPVSHAGKHYNVLALEMARALSTEIRELHEVEVQLLSAIGQPLTTPLLVALRCCPGPGGAAPLDEAHLQRIVQAHLGDISSLSMRLARRGARLLTGARARVSVLRRERVWRIFTATLSCFSVSGRSGENR